MLSVANKAKMFYVHRLVAAAFIGPCPEGCEVNHLNGAKNDNRAANLEYVTHQQNQKHSYHVLQNHNLACFKGDRHGSRKLSSSDVTTIREMYAADSSPGRLGVLAKKFGVSISTVWRIVHKLNWKSA